MEHLRLSRRQATCHPQTNRDRAIALSIVPRRACRWGTQRYDVRGWRRSQAAPHGQRDTRAPIATTSIAIQCRPADLDIVVESRLTGDYVSRTAVRQK